MVAELLRNAKGGLELVDAREFLPLFKCRLGLSDWYVLDDFYAIKKEVRKRKYEAKKGAAGSSAATDADAVPVTEAEAAPEPETADAAADAAADGPAEGDAAPGEKEDFSSIADPALRKCLEMGMSYFPDFASVPASLDRKIRKSMFPPTEEEKAWMHLGKRHLLKFAPLAWSYQSRDLVLSYNSLLNV